MQIIKQGYKQTEIGIIPEDWEVKSLSQFSEITSSKRIFESDYVSDGIPFFRGKEISLLIENKGLEDEYFISHKKYEDIKREFGVPQKNEILVTAVGTLGNVYLIPNDEPFYFKDGNLIWLRKIKHIDFKYFAIQIENHKNEIINNAIGSSQKALTIVVLKNQSIPIPPLPEQTAIATALSDIDALIGELDKLIAKKQGIKQATMQQLLTGKKRLAGFGSTSKYKQTEIGIIPEDWEVLELGRIGRFSKGSGIKKDDSQSGEIACVRYGEIYTKHNHVVKNYHSFISHEVARNAKKLKTGDILFAGSGETKEEIGKSVAVIDDMDVYAGGDIVVFSPLNSDSIFLGYLLDTPLARLQKSSRGQGDAVVHISASNLSSVKIPIPTLKEQTAIANILSDMDAEISQLEGRRAKMGELKQGMMQELLTGRIRLNTQDSTRC